MSCASMHSTAEKAEQVQVFRRHWIVQKRFCFGIIFEILSRTAFQTNQFDLICFLNVHTSVGLASLQSLMHGPRSASISTSGHLFCHFLRITLDGPMNYAWQCKTQSTAKPSSSQHRTARHITAHHNTSLHSRIGAPLRST